MYTIDMRKPGSVDDFDRTKLILIGRTRSVPITLIGLSGYPTGNKFSKNLQKTLLNDTYKIYLM